MNKIFEKPEPFDLICAFALFVFVSISVYLFSISQYILSVLSVLFAAWALVIIVGRILFGPVYLEGHMVRLLLKYGSRMKESDLQKCYAQYGSLDFIVSRLTARGVVKVENGIIELVEDKVSSGFKNKLMMWGTRKVKI